MTKNLVELMEFSIHRNTFHHQFKNLDFGIPYEKDCHYCNDREWLTKIAKDCLSVVKEHIGEVAQRCPDCYEGLDLYGQPCKRCKTTGVIARTEGDV
jgi:hypothetical protein